MSHTADERNPIYEVLERAKSLAAKMQSEFITLEHLALALLEDDSIKKSLGQMEHNPSIDDIYSDIESYAQKHCAKAPNATTAPRDTVSVNRVVKRAIAQATVYNRENVLPIDLLMSLLVEDDCHAEYYFRKQKVDVSAIEKVVKCEATPAGAIADLDEPMDEDDAKKVLAQFCVLLNKEAEEGRIDPVIGRAHEMVELAQVLARKRKNNAILVGEPGVGKTAVMDGLALLVHEGRAPKTLEHAQIYSMEIGALLAGTKYRGDVEQRVKDVLRALETVQDPVLFIDEIHMIVGGGSSGEGGTDVANLLKPALAKGYLRCIGGTTYEEYRKHIEKDAALRRRFLKIDVTEPTIDEAIEILAGLRDAFSEYHNVSYTDSALEAAVKLTDRYIHDKFLPDKAIDIIDSVAARRRVTGEDDEIEIALQDIENEVSRVARIPASALETDESIVLSSLNSSLKSKVFGQDHAIEEIADAVMVARAGLRESDKTQGSYLLVGPSGTGKTEVCKRLAEEIGCELLRFDMSEYMEEHSVSKLIGAPPGYKGYDEAGGSGQLLNEVEKHSHCVLLLDEIEKAHPRVMNVLLQVMDNAMLKGSGGKTVSFRNVHLFMTSNAGAQALESNPLGFTATHENQVSGKQDEVIKRTFTPEFRNRLDGIVKFNTLNNEVMLSIVDKFVGELNSLAAERDVTVQVTDTAREQMAKDGYDPAMGARPLGRVINNEIKKKLAPAILFGEAKDGGVATIDYVDGKYAIKCEAVVKQQVVDNATA